MLSYSTLGVQTVESIVHERELVILGEQVNLFYMPVPQSLCGRTLSGADIGRRCGLNIIAIQQNGQLITNPTPGTRLPEGAELVAFGTADQREAFSETYS